MPSHRKSPAHRSKQRKNQHAAGIDCSRFQQQQSVNQNKKTSWHSRRM